MKWILSASFVSKGDLISEVDLGVKWIWSQLGQGGSGREVDVVAARARDLDV